ncbi:CHASE domain-containing protein [bacterium]|nr:CHASE domain-containing protein [bacterium]
MQKKTTARLFLIAKSMALVVTFICSIVMMGWFLHSLPLVQLIPNFPPMQFNTALVLLLSAGSLLLLSFNKSKQAFILGLLVLLFGAIIIAEYFYHFNLVDTLFITPFVLTSNIPIGRPAPNTAVCFMITGFLIMGLSRGSAAVKSNLNFYLSHTLATFAFSALLGYVLGFDKAFGWGHLTRMAVPTAVCFIALSIGFISLTWNKKNPLDRLGAVFTMALLLPFLFLQLLLNQNGETMRDDFKRESHEKVMAITREFELIQRALEPFIGFFEGSENVTDKEFYIFSKKTIIDKMGLQAIDWLPIITDKASFENNTGISIKERTGHNIFKPTPVYDFYVPVLFSAPKQDNSQVLGFNHASEKIRLEAMIKAAENNTTIASAPIDLIREPIQDQKGIIVYAPFYKTKNTNNSFENTKGFLAAIIRIPLFIKQAFSYTSEKDIAVSFADITNKTPITIYSDIVSTGIANENLDFNESFDFFGRHYQVTTFPTADFFNNYKNPFTWLSFALVFALSFILAAYIRREMYIRENLKEKNRDLEQFTHIVSHELRNPLTLLKESVSQIYQGYAGELNVQQKKFLEITLRSIQRLVKSTSELLDVAKIEEGKEDLHLSEFDLVEVAHDIIGTFQVAAESRKIAIKESYSQPKIMVKADENKISRVITNFLTNAFKYTKQGYVEIAIATTPKEVTLSITDTGSGIPAEFIPRVFSKFEQFSGNPHARDLGTGLGLALCKEIIQLHGGHVGVESTVGKGSRFYFTFPLKMI